MACEECGFDPDRYDEVQLERTLAVGPGLARMHGDGSLADGLPREGADAEAVHALLHRLHAAGRARHAATAQATGLVLQLNVSGGGVPKLPVDAAEIAQDGLVGDRQEDRTNHGRAWQAVCLWAAEAVDALAADGHPIGYGCAGENVTVRGLDWAQVTPGARLRVGDALLHVWAYAIPCSKNARWFYDGGFHRLSHEVTPGGSRVYASVVRGGRVRVGDPVVLEP